MIVALPYSTHSSNVTPTNSHSVTHSVILTLSTASFSINNLPADCGHCLTLVHATNCSCAVTDSDNEMSNHEPDTPSAMDVDRNRDNGSECSQHKHHDDLPYPDMDLDGDVSETYTESAGNYEEPAKLDFGEITTGALQSLRKQSVVLTA